MNDLCDIVEAPAEAEADLMAPQCGYMSELQDTLLACSKTHVSELERAEELIAQLKDSKEWREIDRWEQMAAELPQQNCPLDHVFTPGLYTRIIHMRAGTQLTSKIHLFEHPYILLQGIAAVWTLEVGWVILRAPFVGITSPGTRRLLYIISDAIWITSHVTQERDPDRIVNNIFYDHMKLGHMADVSPEKMAAIRLNQKGLHTNELR